MSRFTLAVLALLTALPAAGADLTLLAGYQYNWDFKLSDEAGSLPEGIVDGEPGDDVALDGGAAAGLALDFVYRDNPDQRLGLFLSHHQARFEAGAGIDDRDVGITHLHFTGTSYYPQGNWEPFVLAGIGATWFSPDDSSLDDTARFSLQVGGGSNYRISDSVLLRLEARWIPAFFDSSSAGICSGGCTIAVKSTAYSQFQVNAGLMFRF